MCLGNPSILFMPASEWGVGRREYVFSYVALLFCCNVNLSLGNLHFLRLD
jgi:hypothetical protein